MISYYGMPKAPDMTGTFMPSCGICTTFMQLPRRYDSKKSDTEVSLSRKVCAHRTRGQSLEVRWTGRAGLGTST